MGELCKLLNCSDFSWNPIEIYNLCMCEVFTAAGLHVSELLGWAPVVPGDKASLGFKFRWFWPTISKTRGCGAGHAVSGVHLGNFGTLVAFWTITRTKPRLWDEFAVPCCILCMLSKAEFPMVFPCHLGCIKTKGLRKKIAPLKIAC